MTARFTLNIGLDGIGVRLQALRALNFKIVGAQTVQSDTEKTVVATVNHGGDAYACANWLAERLHQDCVAILDNETGEGRLVGPRAAKWGAFNPEFFFTLDGQRLAPATAKAA